MEDAKLVSISVILVLSAGLYNTKDAQGLAMEKAFQAKDRSGNHTEAFVYLRSSLSFMSRSLLFFA